MLAPKKVKHRKWQTKRINPKRNLVATRGVDVSFGSHGLKAVDYGRITSNQIEAARKTVTRILKKTGRMWIRIFPDRPFTAKPAEVKMGKGKGDIKGYVAEVLPGRVLFEIDGLDEATSKEALRKAGAKLPIRTKVVKRN